MAAQLFSPLITRLRRRGNERLLENDMEIPLNNVGAFESDQTSEKNPVNSAENNYSTSLLDSNPQQQMDSTTNENIMTIQIVNSTRAPTKRKFFHFLGITLAIIGSLVFSVAALLVKLAESIPSFEVVFIRLTLQLVFCLPPMTFFKDQFIHSWKKTKFLLLRGVTGVTAMSLMVYSVKHMPLADARVIFYTSPVFTALLGRIFLKESVSMFHVIATLLSLGGVVLIGRPTFLFGSLGKSSSSQQVWLPTVLAILAAIFTAFSFVLLRKMSQDVGTRVVVFYFSLVGSVISLSASLISGGFKYPDCGTHDVVYAIVNGVLGYFGQLMTTKACELEKASIVSLVRTIGIAFSFLLQLIFLDIVPNGLSIGGAILVLLCNVFIFIKKLLDQRKLENVPAAPL